MRGYFEIGVFHPKTEENIGALWRTAYQLGASGIFTIGRRYKKQASDTYKAWRHIPLREFLTLEDFLKASPHNSLLVGVEQGGSLLKEYKHPERAMYLLGAEDHGLSEEATEACNNIVSLPSVRQNSYNVAVAGGFVMMDRFNKIIQ